MSIERLQSLFLLSYIDRWASLCILSCRKPWWVERRIWTLWSWMQNCWNKPRRPGSLRKLQVTQSLLRGWDMRLHKWRGWLNTSFICSGRGRNDFPFLNFLFGGLEVLVWLCDEDPGTGISEDSTFIQADLGIKRLVSTMSIQSQRACLFSW